MHQYTQKLSKAATNATVVLPYVLFAALCWWCGTPPTTSITKLESAKNAVTRAFFFFFCFFTDVEETCFTLVSPAGCFKFSTPDHWKDILSEATVPQVKGTPYPVWADLFLHENNTGKSARQLADDDQHQYFMPFQSQVSIFNGLSVNPNYMVKKLRSVSVTKAAHTPPFASKAHK